MYSDRVLLVCHASQKVGLGHLSRIMVLAHALRQHGIDDLHILVFGEEMAFTGLNEFNASFVASEEKISLAIREACDNRLPGAIVLDLYPGSIPPDIIELLNWLGLEGVSRIGLDGFLDIPEAFDLIWVPSFFVDPERIRQGGNKIVFGWDAYLLRKLLPNPEWRHGNVVLVLTGGGDPTGLSLTLPRELDAKLPSNMVVNWVVGPFAKPPLVPDKSRLEWIIHNAPDVLDHLIVNSNYALAVFGVSFFEVLQYGIPAVVFSPYGARDSKTLEALSRYDVAEVAFEYSATVSILSNLISHPARAKKISENASSRLGERGVENLATRIISMMES